MQIDCSVKLTWIWNLLVDWNMYLCEAIDKNGYKNNTNWANFENQSTVVVVSEMNFEII